MIDLHCHMLPGIDDGPKTMDQALEMAVFAVEQGIKRCVLTPHIHPNVFDNDFKSIQSIYKVFESELMDKDIPLQVGMAAEVRVCAELPIMISQNKIPFLGKWNGLDVILLEFPHDNVPLGADKLISWLIQKNIVPLIAHPERNKFIIRHPDKIKPFLDMGCLLQITADSITGLFGEDSQKCAINFIEKDSVCVIASDAHNLHKRKPTLSDAVKFLRSRISEEQIERLTVGNPEKIVSSQVSIQ